MIGIWEVLGILALIILAWWILGRKFKKEAPEIGKTVGETLKEFKKAVTEVGEIKKVVKKKKAVTEVEDVKKKKSKEED